MKILKTKRRKLRDYYGHKVIYLLKFHPELNPIEQAWAKAKKYTRAKCDYTYEGLKRKLIPAAALDGVLVDDIRKYFRKSRDYDKKSQRIYTNPTAMFLN